MSMKKSIVCIETGIVYESVRDAARKNDINHSTIYSCVKGRKKSAGGYHWEYLSTEDSEKQNRLTNEEFLDRFHNAQEIYPSLKNIEIIGNYKSYFDKIECRCLIHNNIWYPQVSNLLSGHGCAKCGRIIAAEKRHLAAVKKHNLKTMFPEIAKEWDYESNEKRPEDYSYGAADTVFWICPVGHSYRTKICLRTCNGVGCSICNKINHSSFPEQAIIYYLNKGKITTINSFREGLGRFELDVYLPDYEIGIEYDGAIAHSEKTIGKEERKYLLCKERGIKLIRIREDESGLNDLKICDYSIKSEYATMNKSKLDVALKELFALLNVTVDVNTLRDERQILEQYYSRLKNNSLAEVFPEIASEWNQELNGNLSPEMFFSHSNYKVWWNCLNGHKPYKMSINDRVRGHGCSECSGTKKYTQETFEDKIQIVNPRVKVIGTYINNKTPIQCQCLVCNTIWQALPGDLLKGHGCNKCAQLIRDAGKKKKVICIDTKTVYSSITEASKETGISFTAISKCVRKESNLAGGKRWAFYSNDCIEEKRNI